LLKSIKNTSTWLIRWCGCIYYYWVLVNVCVCGTVRNQTDSIVQQLVKKTLIIIKMHGMWKLLKFVVFLYVSLVCVILC